jgi:DNA (cytosine-5)-methyltransferase 1
VQANETPTPTFIDLFAGCGGLSLGMSLAGWQGVFAIEKADDAFKTFEANFLSGPASIRFEWPNWLEKRAHSIEDVLRNHEADIRRLRGSIDVVAGGPPCQGFSFAGRRNKNDPRNRLFEQYVQFVSDVQPKVVVLENVNGMQIAHGASKRGQGVRPAQNRSRTTRSWLRPLTASATSLRGGLLTRQTTASHNSGRGWW